MTRKFLFLCLSLFFFSMNMMAQEKSSLQSQAEVQKGKGNLVNARAFYVRAYEDYAKKGNVKQGVECGLNAVELYYKGDNLYREGFDLLRRIDQSIDSKCKGEERETLHYRTAKIRYEMYLKMGKNEEALGQLNTMEKYAKASNDSKLTGDQLYNKTIYHYTMGQNEKGDATFRTMTAQLLATKEYDKVDKMYETLIDNGRRNNNTNLMMRTYQNYVAWKDSVGTLKVADTINGLKQQIAQNEADIADKESSLIARQAAIVGLSILAAVLAAVLVLGGILLMRNIILIKKQKKTIKTLSENNALKAQFISNISAQLEPTLKRLDSHMPEVKALLDFSDHIQTLSELESSNEKVEREETQLASFCEELMDKIRHQARERVVLTVDAPKMTAKINREMVSHILLHLLRNATIYTPEGGHITLEYKKRGAHKHQFLVSNTGESIPEEERENVFKPFLTVRDLTTGDGLGLPICKQMAMKMDGDLDIDPAFTKGTRFMLHLHDD